MNYTNPGAISHNEILELYKSYIDSDFTWKNFSLEEQAKVIIAPRSNNLLDTARVRPSFWAAICCEYSAAVCFPHFVGSQGITGMPGPAVLLSGDLCRAGLRTGLKVWCIVNLMRPCRSRASSLRFWAFASPSSSTSSSLQHSRCAPPSLPPLATFFCTYAALRLYHI